MDEAVLPATREQWEEFLRELTPDPGSEPTAPAPPVSEAGLADLESRLGVVLPAGYRNFLLVADGSDASDDLYRMYPAAEVGWARDVLAWLLEAWEDFDDVTAMLARCLVVGDDESNAYYLLDPGDASDDASEEGAWTAIEWWTTPSEITPYPSFGALASWLARPQNS